LDLLILLIFKKKVNLIVLFEEFSGFSDRLVEYFEDNRDFVHKQPDLRTNKYLGKARVSKKSFESYKKNNTGSKSVDGSVYSKKFSRYVVDDDQVVEETYKGFLKDGVGNL
jgi:hypothetical protein